VRTFCSHCGKMVQPDNDKCPVCGLRLGLDEGSGNFLSGPYVQQRPLVTLSQGDILVERFKIKRSIGIGRFSSVYLAEDSLGKKEVALKVVEVGPMSNDIADLQLRREMKIHSRISNHKYVIKIYDMHYAHWGGTGLLLLSMEYGDGDTFRKFLLEHSDDLKKRQTIGLNYFKQACHGVEAVHEAKAVHLDLKPENLLFCGEVLKVSDFGAAKAAQQMTQMSASSQEMSSIGEGTPAYMSPEHISAPHPDDVDSRADIYALGIILFELLHPTCRQPFGGSNTRLKECHLTVPAPYLKEACAGMADIIAKCLEKDPANRYQTVRELIDDVEMGFRSEVKLSKPITKTIFEAAGKGDLAEVQAHLHHGAQVDIRDEKGFTSLHWASGEGHPEVATFLIKKGANINAWGQAGDTPLHAASWSKKLDIINLLIKYGADVDLKNENGSVPLHYAALFSGSDVASLLIKNGANVNIRNKEGLTPLLEAAIAGNSRTAAILIENGANLNDKTKDGKTALEIAQESGFRMLSEFIKHYKGEKSSLEYQKMEDKEGYNKIFNDLMKQPSFRKYPKLYTALLLNPEKRKKLEGILKKIEGTQSRQ